MECVVIGCTNKCAALDHFHGTELSEAYKTEQQIIDASPFRSCANGKHIDTNEHFCGKEHQCASVCSHDGYCQVSTQKHLAKDEVFIGARDKFKYNLKFTEQGQKFKCRRKIMPFEKSHEGNHFCSNEIHFCTIICPTCENICDKP